MSGARRTDVVRGVIAHVVWTVGAAVASWLALAALLVGLRVEEGSVAGVVVRWADWVDLPYVGRGDAVLAQTALEPSLRTVSAWGAAALTWLAVGAVVALLLRPRRHRPERGRAGSKLRP